jgi:hypothetical protein
MIPDLLGSTELIADAPQLYVPDKTAVTAGHELRAQEEIIPSEVTQLDKVTTEVTAPRQIIDVSTLLHVNRASLRPNNDRTGKLQHCVHSMPVGSRNEYHVFIS